MEQTKSALKLKKRWPSVISIILCVILLFAAIFAVVIALADFQHGEVPTIFGWGICSSNGEYEPIDKNAAILIRKIDTTDTIKEGDVVLFYYEGARANHKVFAGQVLEIGEETLHVYINEDMMDVEITKSVLRGEVYYYMQHVGYVLNIVEDRYGVILSIAFVVLLISIIILLIGNFVSAGQQRKVVAALNTAQEHADTLTAEYEKSDKIPGALTEAEVDESFEEGLKTEDTDGFAPAKVKEDEPLVEIQEEKRAATSAAEEQGEATPAEVLVSEATKQELPVNAVSEDTPLPIAEQKETVSEETMVKTNEPEVKAEKSGTNMMFLFSVQEARLLKRLLEVAAQKRNTQISATVDEQTPALRVNCGAEDVAYVNGIVAAFKKRRSEKEQV